MQTQHHLDNDAYDRGLCATWRKGDLMGMAVCNSRGSPTALDSDQPAELPVPEPAQALVRGCGRRQNPTTAYTISVGVPQNWQEDNTQQSDSGGSPLQSMLNLEPAPSECIHADNEWPDGTVI